MKKVFIFLFAMGASVAAMAQGTANSSKFYFDAGFEAGTPFKKLTPLSFDLTVGYRLTNTFGVFAKGKQLWGMYKDGDYRTYFDSRNLGGGVYYNFFKEAATANTWSANASVTTSIGNVNWKNTSYDIGVSYTIGGNGKALNTTFGLGYRFINSRTDGMNNWNGLFARIGIGF